MLLKTVKDVRQLREDILTYVKSRYKGLLETDGNDFLFDFESALYWYCSDNHGGMFTELYQLLCLSEFHPSPLHNSVESEGEVPVMIYDTIGEYCKENSIY
jgi:hypothetical protein